MKIKVGDFDILDSGSIVGNLNDPIDFVIDTQYVKTLRFIFVNDNSTKRQKVLATESKSETKTIELVFTNYNNPLGTGNNVPLPLGKHENRSLFLNYRIYNMEGAGKHIHYTWLLGKEVNDE